MLKSLLVFASITVALCHINCPAYSAFDDFCSDRNLQDLLCGTFSVAYTSAAPVSCLKIAFETAANNAIIGRIQSPGCCIKAYYNNSTSTELSYDIGPVPLYARGCPLLVNEKGSMKFLGKTGSSESLCLIVAVCEPDYYGINVMCRGSPPPLQNVKNLLLGWIGDRKLIDALNFQSVSQSNCPIENCP